MYPNQSTFPMTSTQGVFFGSIAYLQAPTVKYYIKNFELFLKKLNKFMQQNLKWILPYTNVRH